jgi:hypothetical protein
MEGHLHRETSSAGCTVGTHESGIADSRTMLHCMYERLNNYGPGDR